MNKAATEQVSAFIGTTGRAAELIALVALLSGLPCEPSACAQEMPLHSCRGLATIDVIADQRALRFVVDTGATSSLLNARKFRGGDAARVVMHSWDGKSFANARAAEISDLAIGGRHLGEVSFLAVDLSDLGRECGNEIDGILGADLIGIFGLQIDLKKRVARFAVDSKDQETRSPDLSEQFERCRAAFDHSDGKAFGDCLDPDVVLVVAGKEHRGRDAVLSYFDHAYFGKGRSATMTLDRSGYHMGGWAAWLEYELCTRLPNRTIRERGTALLEKSGEKWLVISLNHSVTR